VFDGHGAAGAAVSQYVVEHLRDAISAKCKALLPDHDAVTVKPGAVNQVSPLSPLLSPLFPQPSTLNPQPSTVNRQLSTVDGKADAVNQVSALCLGHA
jgi:hypothetical protein